VARGLRSRDGAYLAEAISYQRKGLEDINAIAKEACDSIAALREFLALRQAGYQLEASARSFASSAGISTCAAVTAVDTAVTHHALCEGAQAAAQSPFTSWTTTEGLHMKNWTTPGGWFSGAKVHSAASVVHHFYVPAFISSGCLAFGCLGGVVALGSHRWRRMRSWYKAEGMVTGVLDALRANEDHWRGITFPCDQVTLILDEVGQAPTSTSHQAVMAWKKILRDTAMLITAIDTYLVWLDMAGWVPKSFPLEANLRSPSRNSNLACGGNRYQLLAKMLDSPSKGCTANADRSPPRALEAGGKASLQAIMDVDDSRMPEQRGAGGAELRIVPAALRGSGAR